MLKIFSIYILSIFFSVNSYANSFMWIEQNSGTTQTLTSVYSTNGQVVWVCGYGGTVLRSPNCGATWINVSGNGIPPATQLISIVCQASSQLVALAAGYVGSNTFLYRTSNGGSNWTQVFTQPNGFINSVKLSVTHSNDGFMMGDPVDGRWSLWKTTNAGISWDSTGLFLAQSGTEAGWVNSMFSIQDKIWFGTNNIKIYYSSNFGSTWNVQSTVGEINSFAVWFCGIGNSELGYFGGTTLQRTTNGGTLWRNQPTISSGNFGGITGGPNILIDNTMGYQSNFYVRTDNKIYSSHNFDSVWSVDYTAPSGTYRYVASDYGGIHFWAVRDNGGISYLDLPVGISNNNTETPSGFNLEQNYPNPFNPSTVIRYSLSENRFVNITVYDMLGKHLMTLVNQKQNAGSYEVEFNGSDLPSGIYFYKLTAQDFSDTKRMILLK